MIRPGTTAERAAIPNAIGRRLSSLTQLCLFSVQPVRLTYGLRSAIPSDTPRWCRREVATRLTKSGFERILAFVRHCRGGSACALKHRSKDCCMQLSGSQMSDAQAGRSSGAGPRCNVQANRRDVLAAACVLGVNATVDAVVPAIAEPADERPKEGDYLVAI